MIKIGILGDIGAGKSYVAQNFGYPVFNADYEVAKLYKQNKNVYENLKKKLPKYIHSFPIEKKEVSNAILSNKKNIKKIVKIIHFEIRKKQNNFIKTNISSFLLILFSNSSGISKITIFLFFFLCKNVFIVFLFF